MSARLTTLSLILAAVSLGCSSMKQSDTARTGSEQLLISNAVDQSLSKCDFAAFQGTKVFLEDKYFESVDKAYVLGSVRHRLMMNGATIAAKPEESEVVIEMRSGGIGTDNADGYIGIPQIVLPGLLTLPEVKFWERSRQSAIAKIGMVAYDTRNHEMLGAGGVTSSMSDDTNIFFVGIGPWQSGTARDEIAQSTQPKESQPNQQVPIIVAFRKPNAPPNIGQVQLTGDQTEQK